MHAFVHGCVYSSVCFRVLVFFAACTASIYQFGHTHTHIHIQVQMQTYQWRCSKDTAIHIATTKKTTDIEPIKTKQTNNPPIHLPACNNLGSPDDQPPLHICSTKANRKQKHNINPGLEVKRWSRHLDSYNQPQTNGNSISIRGHVGFSRNTWAPGHLPLACTARSSGASVSGLAPRQVDIQINATQVTGNNREWPDAKDISNLFYHFLG